MTNTPARATVGYQNEVCHVGDHATTGFLSAATFACLDLRQNICHCPAMNKQTVRTITDALGSVAIQERLGVTEFSIRHARREGSFAASWYAAMKAMCDEAGVDCPMSAFNWKTSEPASPSEASNAR